MRLIRLLKRDLAKEVTDWAKENLISTDQAVQICQRYGIDYHHQQDNSLGYHVLVVLGYLFIGLAIIVLVGHNWEDIPRGLRMGALIVTTLSFNLFGLWQYQNDKPHAAVGCLFLGSLCYGATIMLIAQIYHIGEHYPDGVLFWALGVLPLAIFMRSTLLMLLTATLAIIWLFAEASLDYYPLLFPIFLVAIAWHVFKVKQSSFLFLVLVLSIALFFMLNLAWFAKDNYRFNLIDDHILIAGMISVLFYGFARWLQTQKNPIFIDYGVLLAVWTLRASIVLWFIYSFDDPWHSMMRHDWDRSQFVSLTSISFSVVSIALVYFAYRSVKPMLGTIGFVLFFNIGLFAILYIDPSYSEYMQVFANLVLIIAGIWLLAQGVHEGITHYFYLGILTIMLTALLRYIDLVGDYIGASILFAVFAGILLAAAKFWKKHLQTQDVTVEVKIEEGGMS